MSVTLGDVPSRFTNNDGPPAAHAPRRADAATSRSEPGADTAAAPPNWFADFVIDRATRKPSEHTMKAYRQDFAAVAALLTAGSPADIAVTDITKNTMRATFAAYASTHEPASIRRCWSTWNVLCDFLYTAELIPANPMPFVGRPKAAKTLPRSLPQPAVGALLDAVEADREPLRRTDWSERDLSQILTGLLAGLRADSCAEPMSVISARAPAAVRLSTSTEKAARTAPCRSRPPCCQSSRTTSIAGPAASPPP